MFPVSLSQRMDSVDKAERRRLSSVNGSMDLHSGEEEDNTAVAAWMCDVCHVKHGLVPGL